MKKTIVFSKKILSIKNIHQFFPLLTFFYKNKNIKADAIAGWGYRPTTIKARSYAEKNSLIFISLEDGFLRSIGLGLDGYPPLSLIADEIGIYYDSRTPSKLENLIKNKILLKKHNKDAVLAMELIKNFELTKYNHAANFCGFNELSKEKNEKVLVVDQTLGDMAVQLGGANKETFSIMLETAIKENPDSTIYVKTHTDVINKHKKGYLTNISIPNVILFNEDVNSISLLKKVDKVYVVTSHMGFEALLIGKQVITFGLPWYAGWGVTDDRNEKINDLKRNDRRTHASILELFTAAYVLYCNYINPYTGKQGTIFDVINYLNKIKFLNNKLRGTINLIGFSFWKKRVLLPYLQLPSIKLSYHSINQFIKIVNDRNQKLKIQNQKLLIWGQGKKKLLSFINDLNPIRMEDGFVRSLGLGSNLNMPYSLVIDELGIYFNSNNISELEFLLANKQLTKAQIQKGQNIRYLLIKTRLGKYNVGQNMKIRPDNDKKVILIPGQVEDDASILYGSPIIKTNIDLIKIVRKNNPNDYIIYKPHPDVLSGNRKGMVDSTEINKYVDKIIEFVDIIDCIEQIDEIHTMTSLAGFEALIRGKKVICYGQPFYSSWGLTIDKYPVSRRVRNLTLDELIYIVMYEYAVYIHPDSLEFTEPEILINYLNTKKIINKRLIKQNWLTKQVNKLKQIVLLIYKLKIQKFKI
jgi:Capsule polysaccharide export protein